MENQLEEKMEKWTNWDYMSCCLNFRKAGCARDDTGDLYRALRGILGV